MSGRLQLLPAVTSPVEDDGNEDACSGCMNIREEADATLICCDFCPSAFHADCAGYAMLDDVPDGDWACWACALRMGRTYAHPHTAHQPLRNSRVFVAVERPRAMGPLEEFYEAVVVDLKHNMVIVQSITNPANKPESISMSSPRLWQGSYHPACWQGLQMQSGKYSQVWCPRSRLWQVLRNPQGRLVKQPKAISGDQVLRLLPPYCEQGGQGSDLHDHDELLDEDDEEYVPKKDGPKRDAEGSKFSRKPKRVRSGEVTRPSTPPAPGDGRVVGEVHPTELASSLQAGQQVLVRSCESGWAGAWIPAVIRQAAQGSTLEGGQRFLVDYEPWRQARPPRNRRRKTHDAARGGDVAMAEAADVKQERAVPSSHRPSKKQHTPEPDLTAKPSASHSTDADRTSPPPGSTATKKAPTKPEGPHFPGPLPQFEWLPLVSRNVLPWAEPYLRVRPMPASTEPTAADAAEQGNATAAHHTAATSVDASQHTPGPVEGPPHAAPPNAGDNEPQSAQKSSGKRGTRWPSSGGKRVTRGGTRRGEEGEGGDEDAGAAAEADSAKSDSKLGAGKVSADTATAAVKQEAQAAVHMEGVSEAEQAAGAAVLDKLQPGDAIEVLQHGAWWPATFVKRGAELHKAAITFYPASVPLRCIYQQHSMVWGLPGRQYEIAGSIVRPMDLAAAATYYGMLAEVDEDQLPYYTQLRRHLSMASDDAGGVQVFSCALSDLLPPLQLAKPTQQPGPGGGWKIGLPWMFPKHATKATPRKRGRSGVISVAALPTNVPAVHRVTGGVSMWRAAAESLMRPPSPSSSTVPITPPAPTTRQRQQSGLIAQQIAAAHAAQQSRAQQQRGMPTRPAGATPQTAFAMAAMQHRAAKAQQMQPQGQRKPATAPSKTTRTQPAQATAPQQPAGAPAAGAPSRPHKGPSMGAKAAPVVPARVQQKSAQQPVQKAAVATVSAAAQPPAPFRSDAAPSSKPATTQAASQPSAAVPSQAPAKPAAGGHVAIQLVPTMKAPPGYHVARKATGELVLVSDAQVQAARRAAQAKKAL